MHASNENEKELTYIKHSRQRIPMSMKRGVEPGRGKARHEEREAEGEARERKRKRSRAEQS